MSTTLKIFYDGKPAKKILWKDNYSKIKELKLLIETSLKLENCYTGIFGQSETGLIPLTTDKEIDEFKTFCNQKKCITIEVYTSELSRDDSYITKNYNDLYRPIISTSSILKYQKTEDNLHKSNFEKFKTLKTANFLEFSNENYSPYHVVRKLEGYLRSEGFTRLLESEKWELITGKKYYVKRGHFSALIAFVVPSQVDTEKVFFKIIGTHCDSPCLRLCPLSKISTGNYLQLDVQNYGGGLWKTWFDRELCIGGRVTLKNKSDPNKLEVKIYTSKEPFAYIPSMCPHLQNIIDETPLNPEIHLRPIISILGKTGVDEISTYEFLLEDIANTLNVPKELIVDAELCLADATKARVFGPSNEFLAASKMDNTVSAWAGLDAIISVGAKTESMPENGLAVMAAFDHEEIGSQSSTGANSEFLPNILQRIINAISTDKTPSFDLVKRAIARSYLVSADMGHASNPNYPEYFKQNYKTTINHGILVKTNDNLRYTTTSISRTIFRNIALEKQIPLQNYVGRNDKHSGSTIGPMLSSLLGIESIDVGGALLGMHSIRELIGVNDLVNYAELFKGVFQAKQVLIVDDFK